jgi:E3 ubiquitin-protein ligase UBR7
LLSLQADRFLLEEEETYEPPDDPDSGACTPEWILCLLILPSPIGLSLEELGIRALERLPRDKAIDGIHAFNELRYVSSVVSCVSYEITNKTLAMI